MSLAPQQVFKRILFDQIDQFLSQDDSEFLWLKDDFVWYDGDINQLFHSFDEIDADLLATNVRSRMDDPAWVHWASFGNHIDQPCGDHEDHHACSLFLFRLSKKAAVALRDELDHTCVGNYEAQIPTIISRCGGKILDLNQVGENAPLYDDTSWHWQGPVKFTPAFLHYPVAYAPSKLSQHVFCEDVPNQYKALFFSPVGRGCEQWIESTCATFLRAGIDVRLVGYDDASFDLPQEVSFQRKKGYKWQLAQELLSPHTIGEYDYIFIWDDDLLIHQFDPQKFLQLMAMNRLDIAQPGVLSTHGYAHEITSIHELPFWQPSSMPGYKACGRLTNFVEIMCPVFTKEAWRSFYSYLDNTNISGYGYDYIPMNRKGILDCMSVEHMRPVQSCVSNSWQDLANFLHEHGLLQYQPTSMGWLFDCEANG